jgi:hypothetical protein
MTLRDLLIRAYPRSWRDEFGSELAGILANRKLTPAVVSDVLASAALQHFRRDPWKICTVGFGLWTSGLLIFALEGLVDRLAFSRCYFAGQLFLFAAGAWTGLREDSGIWRATTASAKAAVVPVAAYIVVSSVRMLYYWLHYWSGGHQIQGQNISYWILKNVVVTILASLLFGLAGASFARLVKRFLRAAAARA